MAITFSAEDIAEMKKHPTSYEINEKFGFADISTINYTNSDVLLTTKPGDGIVGGQSYEQEITNTDLYRIRLSYDAVDGAPAGFSFTDADGNDLAGNMQEFSDPEEAYKAVSDGTCTGIAYIPSTGELVFSEQYYKDNFEVGDTYNLTYNKSNWIEGDINPAHYFVCTESNTYTDDAGNPYVKKTAYNTTTADQDIYYDVGFNQQIQVNTLASEVFGYGVRRDMDDFQHCLTQLKDIETKINDIETKMKEFPEDSADYMNWSKKLEAAKVAQDHIRENVHTKFENQITKYQGYMNDNNIAITNNATRGSRLELISTRLMGQKATFKDLQTSNEGIDVTQVAVELTSSELTYQTALMATSKIMQTNLMNYI